MDDKADDNILSLCYNIGKFVYLIDALDDIDEVLQREITIPFWPLTAVLSREKSFMKITPRKLVLFSTLP